MFKSGVALGQDENGVYLLGEVFTPTTPARITFVERQDVNDKLVKALTTPGKQVVVYGHSGSGKTTLLDNKLRQLYSAHVTSRCTKTTTVDALKRDAFDQLDQYYVGEKSITVKKTYESSLEASYLSIKAQLKTIAASEQGLKEMRLLPPELTEQKLAGMMGVKGLCWVIEDFHKVTSSEKVKLSEMMKIFMDCAADFPSVKIIALGAVETARQVVEYNDEMRNRVSEIEVELMVETELISIIEKGALALNLTFPENVKKVIATYSSGLAAVCHQLCFNMCTAAGIDRTAPSKAQLTFENFEKAVSSYVEECSDTIRNNFEKARQVSRKMVFNHPDVILEALSSFDDAGAGRIQLLGKIQRTHQKYTDAMLKKQLPTLLETSRGGLIRYSQNSGQYSFADPIYRVFALTLFHKKVGNGHGHTAETLNIGELIQLLEKELSRIRPSMPVRIQKT